MNNYNKQIFYKPPKVKPSKKLQQQTLPEWNSFQTDLNRYKLTNAEIIKKKVNAVSKNLDVAKKDWKTNIELLQSGKLMYTNYDDNQRTQKRKKKIDLIPRHRFEKVDKSLLGIKARCKSSKGVIVQKETNKKYCYNKVKGVVQDNNNNDDEEEIKMIYNTNKNVQMVETKAQNNPVNSYKTNKNISRPMIFEQFEETLQKMQNEIKNNNAQGKIIGKSNKPQRKEISQQKEEKLPRKKQEVYQEEDENENLQEQEPIEDENDEENNEMDVIEMKNDINNKFNKLNDLENCMKELDIMLDNSKKKSLQMQYNVDFDNVGKEKSDEDYYQDENSIPFDNHQENYNINNNTDQHCTKKTQFIESSKNDIDQMDIVNNYNSLSNEHNDLLNNFNPEDQNKFKYLSDLSKQYQNNEPQATSDYRDGNNNIQFVQQEQQEINFARSYNEEQLSPYEIEENQIQQQKEPQGNKFSFINNNNNNINEGNNYENHKEMEHNFNDISFKNSTNYNPFNSNISNPQIEQNKNPHYYENDIFQDEQPQQLKISKLTSPTQKYTPLPQSKSIQIQQNVIDVSKNRPKTNINDILTFKSPIDNSYTSAPRKEQRNEDNNKMDYIKNLLEKTKSEIDSMNNNFDDIQPSFTSYQRGLIYK